MKLNTVEDSSAVQDVSQILSTRFYDIRFFLYFINICNSYIFVTFGQVTFETLKQAMSHNKTLHDYVRTY